MTNTEIEVLILKELENGGSSARMIAKAAQEKGLAARVNKGRCNTSRYRLIDQALQRLRRQESIYFDKARWYSTSVGLGRLKQESCEG